MTPFKEFRKAWARATTLGFFSLLLMIPMSFLYEHFFGPPQFDGLTLPEIFELTADKSPLEYGKSYFVGAQIGHFLLYLCVGAILSHLQYQVIGAHIPNKMVWTLLTILGLELVLLGDLFYAGLSTGGAVGPLEPLLIALGGGGCIALFQFLYLRRAGIKNGKWVGWWILGIVTGIIVSIPFIVLYEMFLSKPLKSLLSPMTFLVLDWLSFILPYFTLIGFFTGLFSARPLYHALEITSPNVN
jgi:hypothetical protein